jgi:hypothetical protein
MGEWGPVISALCALILALLGLQWKDQRDMHKQLKGELDKKVNREECKSWRDLCPIEHHGPSWEEFNIHSHTGLPKDAKVLR